ncbi:MAG: hydroxyacylglutathione hydrolase [Deltaproteobacteria bacterium]|nr:hydroxyacylglutathione hydrolase [Deltaproteobacteria bacterium]
MVEIIQLKTLSDNYTYLLVESSNSQVAVIDPGSAAPVIDTLNLRGLSLSHILLTHHHFDHSGGMAELKKLYPAAQTAIHEMDAGRLPGGFDRKLKEGDTINFGATEIKIMHLPCHTRGHVAFKVDAALFTGDTLFSAGCGKFFEGSAAEMLQNLERLKKLPTTTEIYCGHEYTIENLEYACKADPANTALAERLCLALATQEKGSALVPSSLALELATNPFLRLDNKTLQKQLKTTNELDTLIELYKIYYRETP